MIDIESLLSSVSDEDMAKIKSVAESLMNKSEPQQEKPKEEDEKSEAREEVPPDGCEVWP